MKDFVDGRNLMADADAGIWVCYALFDLKERCWKVQPEELNFSGWPMCCPKFLRVPWSQSLFTADCTSLQLRVHLYYWGNFGWASRAVWQPGGLEVEFTKRLSWKDAVPAEPCSVSCSGNFTERHCCLWGHLQRLPRPRLPNVFGGYRAVRLFLLNAHLCVYQHRLNENALSILDACGLRSTG